MSRDQGDTPRTPPEESQRQQSPPGRPPQQPQQGGQPPGAPQGRQQSPRSQGQQSPQSQPPGGQPQPQGQLGQSSQGVQPGPQSPQGSVQQGGRQQGGMQQGSRQQPPQGGMQGAQRQPPQQAGQGLQRNPPGMQSQQQGLSAPPMQGAQMGQRGRQSQQMQSQQSGAGLLEPITIDDVVTTDIYTVESDTQISEVVEQMDELNVGSAIVQEDETPIGILTDRKIAMALADDPNVVERTADDLTDGEVVSAMTGTQVSEVLDKMSDESIRRIPVVDENGELEGIVTLDDILMLLESKMSLATDTIQGQLPDV